jgi:hypothetical protein
MTSAAAGAQRTVYLPFLPSDNAVDGSTSEEAVEIIAEDLGHLLRLSAPAFWAIVKSEQSLKLCLESYLRYRR